MERSKQIWRAMIQPQDRKSDRSAVACKDLRTAVFVEMCMARIGEKSMDYFMTQTHKANP
jgi:hypothetical protein